MPTESIYLKVGSNNFHRIKCEEHTPIKIARAVLTKFFKLKGIKGAAELATLSAFVEELLEETPPGGLVFPFSELEAWYERLMLNKFTLCACV